VRLGRRSGRLAWWQSGAAVRSVARSLGRFDGPPGRDLRAAMPVRVCLQAGGSYLSVS